MRLLLCYPLTPDQLQRIAGAVPGWELVQCPQDELAGQIIDCDVFCGHAKVPVDWEAVVQRGRLRWIQSSAAGLDHCLAPPVRESPIQVSSCSGLFRDSVAEQTMALLYGLIRSLPVFFRARAQRDFGRRPTHDLHGLDIGIAGFGGNGQRIAELLMPVAGTITATDVFAELLADRPATPPIDNLWPAWQLDQLLQACQVVISTLPLDGSTERIFGARQFAAMPRGSWFVNVGRGGLVDESALVAALDSGQLAGAGLDVTAIEPLPGDSPLWDHRQVLLTPHVGAQSAGRNLRVTRLLCDNLKRFVAARPLLNLVDKSTGNVHPDDRAPYRR